MGAAAGDPRGGERPMELKAFSRLMTSRSLGCRGQISAKEMNVTPPAEMSGGDTYSRFILKRGKPMMEHIYRKGDVYLVDLGIPHGSEQGGRRPAMIIQNDDGCIWSPTVTIVPMTTAIKKPYQKSHYILRYSECVRYRSMVEAEQIQTIDKDRVIRRIGHLDARDISGIEEAMRNHFGFDIPECIEAP